MTTVENVKLLRKWSVGVGGWGVEGGW